MSYLVFARKWRPRTFEDVVGQAHITDTLKRAIEKNRVAHAYIFTGTRGVGKTTTARILARALNCDKGPTTHPCGECESCRNIINGASFDVLEIDGASNSGVDDIRELRENISYTSMGGKYRIFVIDEVHMLSKSAFNALLKTLEEPPKNVIFIFATTEPQKIPETIHSRCQRYDFRRIATEQIVAQLEKICTEEGIAFEKSGLELIGRRADGSMRDALSLLDQVYSFCQDSVTEKEVRLVLGIVEAELYTGVLEAVAEKKPLPVIQAVEDILNRGFDLLEFVIGFQEYLRTLLFVRLPGIAENQRLSVSLETMQYQTDCAARFSETDLLRMIEVIRRAESELRWSSFPRFLIETALLKLVYMDSSVSVEQILASLKQGKVPGNVAAAPVSNLSEYKKKSDTRTVDRDADAEPVKSIPPKVDTESFHTVQGDAGSFDLRAQWPSFIELLMEDLPNLGTFLSMAYIAECTDTSIDLRFEKQFGFQFAEVTRKNNRDSIQKKLNSFAGKPVNLHLTIEKEDRKQQKQTKHHRGKKRTAHPSLDDDITNEPIIENVIEVFDGEIL